MRVWNVEESTNDYMVVDGDRRVCGYATRKDAELMSAAPDLLAACHAALARLVSVSDFSDPQGEAASIQRRLRMAIAKAEGAQLMCPHGRYGRCDACEVRSDFDSLRSGMAMRLQTTANKYREAAGQTPMGVVDVAIKFSYSGDHKKLNALIWEAIYAINKDDEAHGTVQAFVNDVEV